MPSGLCHGSPTLVEVRALRASKPPSLSGRPAKLFGTLMPASPSSGSGRPARRRPSRRSRRRRGRRRRACPATTRGAAPASRRAVDRVGAPLGVRRVGAGEADDRLAVVRRQQGLDAVGRARDVDRDAAGGEQVGGERRAGGVRATRAEGGQEDRLRGRLVAQRLEAGAVARAPRSATGRPALGERLGEVRELGEPGDRPLPPWRSRSRRFADGRDAISASRSAPSLDPSEDAPTRRRRGRR